MTVPGKERPAVASPKAGRSVLIVGAGLLGASLGLALRGAGWRVWLSDRDRRAEALASDLGAGERARDSEVAPDLVVVAVPPSVTAAVASEFARLYPDAIVTDTASVKTNVQIEVETDLTLASRFVGGHPLAGRERSGPEAARADLFEGRAWVLTPGESTQSSHLALVEEMVSATGAVAVHQTPEEHDAAVALVSHLPQVAASLVAGRLVDGSAAALELAGSGLRDTTRVAESDPELWTQILHANARPVAVLLDQLAADLDRLRAALGRAAAEQGGDEKSTQRHDDESVQDPVDSVLRGLLSAGRAGRARIPGKHGGRAVRYAVVPVVIPDEPGALARLFVAAGDAGVNIEDVSIEHSPGQPVGLVELSVAPEHAADLTRALSERGWLVH